MCVRKGSTHTFKGGHWSRWTLVLNFVFWLFASWKKRRKKSLRREINRVKEGRPVIDRPVLFGKKWLVEKFSEEENQFSSQKEQAINEIYSPLCGDPKSLPPSQLWWMGKYVDVCLHFVMLVGRNESLQIGIHWQEARLGHHLFCTSCP